MSLNQTHVTIHGPRGQEWERVTGRRTFPIRGHANVTVPDRLGEQPAYLLDVDALDAATQIKIVRHLASKFSIPEAHVLETVRQQGVPILAEDCALVIDRRMLV